MSVWYYLTVNSTTARSFVNWEARASATSWPLPSHFRKLLPKITGKREERCYTSINFEVMWKSVNIKVVDLYLSYNFAIKLFSIRLVVLPEIVINRFLPLNPHPSPLTDLRCQLIFFLTFLLYSFPFPMDFILPLFLRFQKLSTLVYIVNGKMGLTFNCLDKHL